MQIRQLWDTDGRCYGKIRGQCTVMKEGIDDHICGTYLCGFYKPEGCEDWAKFEVNHMVKIFPPEEVTYGKNRLESEGRKI